jgi:hypothetical protein
LKKIYKRYIFLLKNIQLVILFFAYINTAKSQAPGCINVNAGNDQTIINCDVSATLSATTFPTANTNTYAVSSISYAPPYPFSSGTPIPITQDDRWSGVISLPFNFCFFGSAYSQLIAGSNGVVSFNTGDANGYCPYAFSASCPSPSLILNAIFGVYHDIDPGVAGTMSYGVIGSYPCRTFVVNWTNVAMFSSTCNSIIATHQIVLYESTNVIEIYVQNAPLCSSWNNGNKLIGIQNANGTLGYTPPGRNTGPWSTSNEAWRFTPNGSPNYTIQWYQGANLISSSPTVTVTPTNTTTYTAVGIYNNCNGTQTTVSDNVTVIVNNPNNPVITAQSTTLCSGQSTLLTLSGYSGTIQWQFSTNGGITWSNISGANSNTYTTPALTTATCYRAAVTCGSTLFTNVICIIVKPIPVATAIPAVSGICSGNNTSISLNSNVTGTTFNWFVTNQVGATGAMNGSGSIISQTLTATGTTNGTVTYAIQPTANGCTGLLTSAMVTVYPQPVIIISPVSPQICDNDSVFINATGAINYSWSGGLDFGASQILSPTSTTTYSVTGTSINGCTGTGSVTVTVNPNPVITVSPTAPQICPGSSVTLTASGADTYNWAGPGTGVSHSVSPTATTTYSVTGTDVNGCSGTASVTVTVNPFAVISITPTAPQICPGSSVTLTASGADTYNWSGLGAGVSHSVSPTATTTYSVTGTDVNGCSGTASVTVTVNPFAMISITPTAPQICPGSSVTLTASGADTYNWSGLGAGVSHNVSPTATTTYFVTGTDVNGCSGTASVTVTVNPFAVISITPAAPQICLGSSVTLTTSGADTYNWSGLGAGVSHSVSPAATTIYTVTGTDVNGCSGTASVTVTVNPNPVITVSPAAPQICPGSTVTLTASGADTYNWAGLGAGASHNVSPSATTTYFVTGTDVNGCSGTASVAVTINPNPVITVSPAAPQICLGSTVTLTASGADTYNWSGLGAGVSHNVSPTATTTYSVTGTDVNGCSGTASVTVTVNPFAMISITPTAPQICPGSSVTLTASGADTYNWSGLGAGVSHNVSPTATTTYFVTGTDVNGCSGTASVTVTVNPFAVISITPAAPQICLGSSVTLTASGADTYNWSGLGAGFSHSASPTATTTYSVTGTDVNGCSGTASVTVTVNPNPVITVSPAAPQICPGSTVTLTASGADIYNWSGLGAGASHNVSPSATTTYSVTGTDVNGCSGTASVTVTVNPFAMISITPTASQICLGSSVTLTASGADTYNWSGLGAGVSHSVSPTATTTYSITGTDVNGCSGTASVTVTVNPFAMISVTPAAPQICPGSSVSLTASGADTYNWSGLGAGVSHSVSPTATTTYSVTGTDVNGCSGTASVTVTVNSFAVINITPTAPQICLGSSVTLTASGADTYNWSGLGAGVSHSVSPTATTTYFVTGTDVNGCSGTASVTVTVNPFAVISITPTAPQICPGSTVTLTASGADTYNWSGLGDGFSHSVSPTATTTYSITGTDVNGCSGTASVTVIVNPNPVITLSPAAPQICLGSSVTLTASGADTYNWSGLGAGVSHSVSPTATTTYSVTGADVNGCSGTASVTVIVNPNPVITVSPAAQQICLGSSVTLTASGADTYNWSGLGAGVSHNVSPTATITYFVTGTDVNGCSGTASVTVTVNPFAVISVTPSNPQICPGSSVTLTASGADTYNWSGLGAGVSHSVSPTATTTYSITGTDVNGCSGTASVTVAVNPNPVITVSPAAPQICLGSSVSLTASGADTYNWSGLGAGVSHSVSPTATTTYFVTGTDVNGCSGTASVTVAVNPNPVITVSPAAQQICLGSSVTLTASGADTYNWSGLGAGFSHSVSPTATTTYSITGTDVNGCSGTASVTVTVNPFAMIIITPTAPQICPGASVTLTASGADTYNWSGLGAGVSHSVSPTATTTYSVTGTDVNGCSGTASVTVTVNPFAMISITPTASQICLGSSVTLTASGADTYNWSGLGAGVSHSCITHSNNNLFRYRNRCERLFGNSFSDGYGQSLCDDQCYTSSAANLSWLFSFTHSFRR